MRFIFRTSDNTAVSTGSTGAVVLGLLFLALLSLWINIVLWALTVVACVLVVFGVVWLIVRLVRRIARR